MKRLALLVSTLLLFCSSCEKQEGCTDPLSYTYNEEAEVDDGSCSYYYGGAENGQLDIGALSNLNESFDIYFDGSFIGTLQNYFTNADFCGHPEAVGSVVSAGEVLVEAHGNSSGEVLYSTVQAKAQECTSAALDNFQSNGNGNGSCDWTASAQCISIVTEWGTRCGNPNALEVTVTNNCSGAIKVYICVQREDGSYSNWADGTFNAGLAVGASTSGYACPATGDYVVGAMPIQAYLDNNCPWPSQCQ